MSERVLEPLEMSDTEILDWLNEYCANLHSYEANETCAQMFDMACYMGTFYGNSIRNVVSLAAAKQREREGV